MLALSLFQVVFKLGHSNQCQMRLLTAKRRRRLTLKIMKIPFIVDYLP